MRARAHRAGTGQLPRGEEHNQAGAACLVQCPDGAAAATCESASGPAIAAAAPGQPRALPLPEPSPACAWPFAADPSAAARHSNMNFTPFHPLSRALRLVRLRQETVWWGTLVSRAAPQLLVISCPLQCPCTGVQVDDVRCCSCEAAMGALTALLAAIQSLEVPCAVNQAEAALMAPVSAWAVPACSAASIADHTCV